MRCAGCGSESEAGQKFCIGCGMKLAVTCPRCGRSNPPSARFCGECGAELAGDPASAGGRPAPIAERRLVSVLFADLVGFTTASEERDAEDTRDLLSRYFEVARRTVERYGGTVEKFIGDAVMAVWGAPTAHEDDAERAVRAALDLVDAVAALDGQLLLRVGVLTGEAAVTIGATGEGMVAGDLVNTASRLEAAAPPGSVLVGESTYRSTQQAIAYEPAGGQQLKGKSGTVPAWRALGVVAAEDGRRSDGIEPPFVGREAELRQLSDLLDVTERDGRAKLVSIIGQPGVGKSRLASEFRRRVKGPGHDVAWHQGRSPAYGEGIAFSALGEMVRQRAGLTDTDDAATVASRLASMLGEQMTDATERSWVEPYLAALLGVGETPSGEQSQQFAAWRAFLERLAAERPLILVFEDLQWADAGLIEFIESLLEWSRAHPILVITLARPELLDRYPSWGAAQRNAASLHLDPLDDDTMTELLGGLLGGVERRALRRIVEQAGGVPLYAVEMVRMLLDDGPLEADEGGYRLTGDLDQLAVPHSLHALVAARLDTLPPGDRALLQDAAVLGHTFTLEALVAMTGSPIEELQARLKGFVRRELLTVEADPRSGAGHYAFIQGVVREVAYDTLSRRDRRARHLAAARHYESVGGEEAVLANHYLESYRAQAQGAEGEAVAAQARIALRAAADRAAALHSHEQAIAYLEQALSVTDAPEERATLLDTAAAIAIAAARREAAERFLHEALEIHRARGDRAAQALAEAGLGSVAISSYRLDEGLGRLAAAYEDLSDLEDPALGRLAAELARGYMLNEEADLALSMAERALVLAAPTGDVGTIAEALTTKGVALDMAARHDEGVAILSGAVRFAELHGLVSSQLRATFNLSARLGADDPGQAHRVVKEGVELARRSGMRDWLLSLTGLGLDFATGAGEWAWVLEQIAQVHEEWLPVEHQLRLKSTEGLVRAMQGHYDHGTRLLREGEDGLAQVSDRGMIAGMRLAKAELFLVLGDYDAAYQQAMAVPEISGYMAVPAYTMASRAALLAGDRERHRQVLARLQALPVGFGGRVNSQLIELAVQAEAALDGRFDEAVVGLRRVAAFFSETGQPLDVSLVHLITVAVLPREHPYSSVAASAAREAFERLGATGLLARLDDLLGRVPAEA